MNCYYLDYDVTMGFAAKFTKVVQNLNLLWDEAENGQIEVDLYLQGKIWNFVPIDKEMPLMNVYEVTEPFSKSKF